MQLHRGGFGGPVIAIALGLAIALASGGASAAAPRADFRLLLKRSGHWSPGQVLVAGPVPALRIAPPAGWWAVTGAAAGASIPVRTEVYQGRAPPVAA